jgi:hypothetical protein
MDIKIIEVSTSHEMDLFINFPRELYKFDKNFTFEPVSMQKEFLSSRNPFFEHSQARYFLAMSDNRVYGRIASVINTEHNRTYNEKTGFFGFFESVENYDVAKLLLDKVTEAHRQSGFQKIIGPTNFTTNDSCGMLISGFEDPAVIMMPYNKHYYNDFLLRYGFVKEMDLSSYLIKNSFFRSAHFTELVSRIEVKLFESDITIRQIDFKKLDKEIIPFCRVYNQSNTNNWGFVPLNETEFKYTANQLKQFVPENLALLVEKNSDLIGFIVALPDLNQVFRKIKSGKLFPFGFLKFLWYRRKIDNSRIMILGVLKEYRNIGIDIVLYYRIQENLASFGINQGEACYVMENNCSMNSILRKLDGKDVKKYRIYKLKTEIVKSDSYQYSDA